MGSVKKPKVKGKKVDGYWGQKELNRLIEMAAAGSTYAEMADEIGTTRNAVAGKINRLKIKHAKRRPVIAKPIITPRVKAIKETKKQVLIKTLIKAPTSTLDFDKCAFPVDGGWCGDTLHGHSSYCEKHHYTVYSRRSVQSKK